MSSNSGSTPQHASFSSHQQGQQPKLQLPLTCDPPGEDNPPQQATWIVRTIESMVFWTRGRYGLSDLREGQEHR